MIRLICGFAISFFVIDFSCKSALGGLTSFTELDHVNGWLIERKIDLRANKTRCRASLANTGTWFSDRARLDEKKEDELVVPANIFSDKRINKTSLETVRDALKRCRSNFIYLRSTK